MGFNCLKVEAPVALFHKTTVFKTRSAEDKENVFRINLDLRVENETMRKELEEKDKLLRVHFPRNL